MDVAGRPSTVRVRSAPPVVVYSGTSRTTHSDAAWLGIGEALVDGNDEGAGVVGPWVPPAGVASAGVASATVAVPSAVAVGIGGRFAEQPMTRAASQTETKGRPTSLRARMVSLRSLAICITPPDVRCPDPSTRGHPHAEPIPTTMS